jgi:hypothetical protein
MLDFCLNNQQRTESVTSREMPCFMMRSESNHASSQTSMLGMGWLEELATLRARNEGFLRGGLLMPLGRRETLGTDGMFPQTLASDDWEEDDDVVDDDDDDDEEEEDEDDFFPGDGDEFEEEEDDDDDDDDEDEEEE